MRNWLLPLACVLLVACASSSQVHNVPFAVEGGRTVKLPVTNGGPLPAENAQFRIQITALVVEPPTGASKRAMLKWNFAFTEKKPANLDEVSVDEVSQAVLPTPEVRDTAPSLIDGRWSGASRGVEPGPSSTPWLYDGLTSIYVFRFTIKPRGGAPVVLYQPAWISIPAKQAFQVVIRNTQGS